MTPESTDEGRRHDVPSIKQAAWSRRIVNRRRDAVSRSMEMAFAVKIHPGLDTETLQRALSRVVERHVELRSIFVPHMDGFRVESLPVKRFQVESYDMSGASWDTVHRAIRQTVDAGFPSLQAPLLRLRTYRIAGEGAVLLFQVHHLVSDSWSVEIVFRDLMAAYLAGGGRVWSGATPQTFEDFVDWEDEFISSAAGVAARAFWTSQLETMIEPVALPYDRTHSTEQIERGGVIRFSFSESLTADIDHLAASLRVTRFSLLLSLFALTVRRIGGASFVPIGVPVARRATRGLLELVGDTAQMIYVGLSPPSNARDFTFFLQSAKSIDESFEHQDFPVQLAIDDLGQQLPAKPGFKQLCFSMLTPQKNDVLGLGALFQDVPGQVVKVPGYRAETIALCDNGCSRDLRLNFSTRDARVYFTLVYNADAFEPATAERLVEAFVAVAQEVVADGYEPLA